MGRTWAGGGELMHFHSLFFISPTRVQMTEDSLMMMVAMMVFLPRRDDDGWPLKAC